MIIYIAGLQAIPTSVMEACQIDGANSIQKLLRVTIPMMMPSITICMFLSITHGFKLFDQNLSLTAGQPMKMSEMMALNIYNTFYGSVGYEGVGQAKAVIFFLVVVGSAIVLVMLGPTLGVGKLLLVLGEEVYLHVTRVVGSIVPEGAYLGLVVGLPVVVHFVNDAQYLVSLRGVVGTAHHQRS